MWDWFHCICRTKSSKSIQYHNSLNMALISSNYRLPFGTWRPLFCLSGFPYESLDYTTPMLCQILCKCSVCTIIVTPNISSRHLELSFHRTWSLWSISSSLKIWNGQRHSFILGYLSKSSVTMSLSKKYFYQWLHFGHFYGLIKKSLKVFCICRNHARRHIVRCWNAVIQRKNLPKMPEEDERFKTKVSFFEVTTESISQFTLSSVIFRIYGISDSSLTKFFQVLSIFLSSLSFTISYIAVSIWI